MRGRKGREKFEKIIAKKLLIFDEKTVTCIFKRLNELEENKVKEAHT